ncbi:hypothetical protein HDU86_004979 [Geranomyces michiganensis]|nr:hypothetical protein HDU86_004979 [Geranomyces michiganensis]
MEWAVTFRAGYQPTTALIQVCNDRHIVRKSLEKALYDAVFPEELRSMLEDTSITKLGRNIKGDALKLYRDFGIMMEGSLDIASIAREVMPGFRKNPSLKVLVEQVLNKALDKGPVRTGNWEATKLSPQQIVYAATDVWAGYRIYQVLTQQAAEKGIKVIPHIYFSMTDHLAEREAAKAAQVNRKPNDNFFKDESPPPATIEEAATKTSTQCQAIDTLSEPHRDWDNSWDSDTDWALDLRR